jgi:hypothetical protein
MAGTNQYFWGRAVLYGLLTEAILIAAFVALMSAGVARDVDTGVAVVGSFALPLVFAMLLGRRLRTAFVVHGFVIGLTAFVIFMAMYEAQRAFGPPVEPQPIAYWVAHALKFAGGMLGGVMAQRRAAGAASRIPV